MRSVRNGVQKLCQDLPWIKPPLISNAPMGGFATSTLAVAVTKAGGLGQIGFLGSVRAMEMEMEKSRVALAGVKAPDSDILPIGIGVVVLDNHIAPWLPTFQRFKPAVIWLSFGTAEQFASWSTAIRRVSPQTKIWIQLGDATAAVEAAQLCKPDALVMQGIDAGGHGHAHGASLISLIPEVNHHMQREGISDIPLLATGGLMDGRGVAAAIMLGASGVVLGTRYLGAQETEIDADIREELFSITDGGKNTVRSRVFDDIWGPSPWPTTYDGRCVRGAIYDNMEAGLSIEEIRMQLYKNNQRGQREKIPIRDVGCLWAGTGIGLLERTEAAAAITDQIRQDMRRYLSDAASAFDVDE